MTAPLYEHLKNISIFMHLDENDIAAIEKYMFFNRVDPGELVFKEGERGDFVCFVVIGKLDIIKQSKGKEVVIHTLSQGDSIGEMALIDNLTRSASVKAAEHSGFMVLTRRGFEMIMRLHPEIGIKMLKGLASSLSLNLRKTSDKLAEFMPQL